jgi:hypothetical protein
MFWGVANLVGCSLNLDLENLAQKSTTNDKIAVELTSTQGTSSNASVIPVTLSLSEEAVDFSPSKIQVINGTLTNFMASNRTYSFDVISNGDGVVSVIWPETMLQVGASTKKQTESASLTFNVDTARPTVQLTTSAGSPTNVSLIPVSVTFSEAVDHLTLSDFTVSGGGASAISFSGSGTNYILNILATISGTISVQLPQGMAFDSTGNFNFASNTLTVIYDSTIPVPHLASTASANTSLSSIPVTVDFSGINVVNLTDSDFVLVNATISGFSGSGANYTFDLIPTGDGVVSVSLPAGVAENSFGTASLASNTLSLNVDRVAPTVQLVGPTPALGSSATSFVWTVDYTDADVVSLVATDVTLGGTGASGCSKSVTGSGTLSRTITVSGCTGNGTLNISLPSGTARDTTGNLVLAVGPSNDAVVDNTPPALAVTGPTPAIGRSSASFVWTLSYSGADTYSLTAAKITLVTTGGVSGCSKSVSGAGSSRSVTVSGCSGTGTVKISIASNTAQDSLGNQSLADTSSTAATVDNSGPSAPIVTLGVTPYNLTNSPVITYSAASDIGGSTVASYQVRIVNTSDSTTVRSWATHTSGTDVGSLGLDMNTEYTVYVRAVDALGNNGSSSTAVTWTTVDGIDCGTGSPSPGETCLGGAIYLGSLNSGSTSSTGLDKYMTTPGGCEDVPNDANRLGVDAGTYYTTADFSPSCSGVDAVVKKWTSSGGYDIPALTSFSETSGIGFGSSYTDNKYGNENASELLSAETMAGAGMSAAASYCQKLVFGGYNDWYLPNRYELNLMFTNKSDIPGLSETYGHYYWSSTEGNGYAWGQQFYDGYQASEFETQKNKALRVRCVRRIGPGEPSSVVLGATSANLTETPAISYGAPSVLELSTSVSHYEVKVMKQMDGFVAQNWITHTSGQKITGLSLDGGFYYKILVRAVDNLGNKGHEAVATFLSEADCVGGSVLPGAICPTGTIFLGTLSPGATTGTGTDKYMTTPGGCRDVPNDGNRGGTGDTTYYTSADFTPLCQGTDTVAKTWNAGGASWSDIPNLTNFTSLVSVDDKYGNQNAVEIISFSAAARYCDKLSYGGYSDWYLPNWRELYLIYENAAVIPGLRSGVYYWSSTEHSSTNAWRMDMDGDLENKAKNYSGNIRCVRRY